MRSGPSVFFSWEGRQSLSSASSRQPLIGANKTRATRNIVRMRSLRVHGVDDGVCPVHQIHGVGCQNVQRRFPSKGAFVQNDVEPPDVGLKGSFFREPEFVVQ